MNTLTRHRMPLTIDGADVRLSCISRKGAGLPIVFFTASAPPRRTTRTWRCTRPSPAGRSSPTTPPAAASLNAANWTKLSIPFLVTTALAALADQGIERFHLVGHSMGGLTSLMLAHQEPGRVASFTDIEGNVAPEDCFLSRQIFLHPHEDPERFLEDFIARNWAAPFYSSPLYATSVRYKVRAGAVRGIFESMVELSDNADLMEKFLALPLPADVHVRRAEQDPQLPAPFGLQRRGTRGDHRTAATSPCTPTPRKCGAGLRPSRRERPSLPCSRRPPAPDQSAPPAASGVPEP